MARTRRGAGTAHPARLQHEKERDRDRVSGLSGGSKVACAQKTGRVGKLQAWLASPAMPHSDDRLARGHAAGWLGDGVWDGGQAGGVTGTRAGTTGAYRRAPVSARSADSMGTWARKKASMSPWLQWPTMYLNVWRQAGRPQGNGWRTDNAGNKC